MALELFDVVDRHFKLLESAVPIFDKFALEQAAEMVRRIWSLGDKPVPNMVHLLESKGVRIVSLAPDYTDIDAFCFFRDSMPYVFVDTGQSLERQRFDVAREMGHLVLHDERRMTTKDSRDREREANAFAAAFLMPATGLHAQGMWSASIPNIFAAKKYWNVSAMAMTHRLREPKLLNDWHYRSTAVTLSKVGYRSGEPDGMVPESSQLLRKVLFGAKGVSLGQGSEELPVPTRDLSALLQGLVRLQRRDRTTPWT